MCILVIQVKLLESTPVYECTQWCTHTHTYMITHMHTHTHTHTYTCTHTSTSTHACIDTHTHTYTHTHIHTHAHTESDIIEPSPMPADKPATSSVYVPPGLRGRLQQPKSKRAPPDLLNTQAFPSLSTSAQLAQGYVECTSHAWPVW